MAINQFQTPAFSLRQLQYALAVAETGGFGAAAALCGVSQPSLSSQVAKLEAVLGTELFVRTPKGVFLSPAGERQLPAFREALNAAALVEATAATLHDPYAVPVRIAVIPTVAPYLLPALSQAMKAGEGPTVHWLELQTTSAEEALAHGKADAIVIADPPTEPGQRGHELGWEPFVVIAPQEMSLPDEVPVSWLHEQQLLLLAQGHCLRDQTLSLCRFPSTQRSQFRATSLVTMVQMVAAGLGVSVLPAMAVEAERARAPIQVRPFVEDTIGRTLTLVTTEGHPLSGVLEELVVAFRGVMPR
ncbi:MAG: hydrogen peroxide-inducible genes activator [Myxococcota bacterium]